MGNMILDTGRRRVVDVVQVVVKRILYASVESDVSGAPYESIFRGVNDGIDRLV